jgi:hypothetical protein
VGPAEQRHGEHMTARERAQEAGPWARAVSAAARRRSHEMGRARGGSSWWAELR